MWSLCPGLTHVPKTAQGGPGLGWPEPWPSSPSPYRQAAQINQVTGPALLVDPRDPTTCHVSTRRKSPLRTRIYSERARTHRPSRHESIACNLCTSLSLVYIITRYNSNHRLFRRCPFLVENFLVENKVERERERWRDLRSGSLL